MLLQEVIHTVHDAIWGVPLLLLLVGVGCYLTFLMRGMLFRGLWDLVRNPKIEEAVDAKGDVTPFQSLMTAMASAVGTGSIVGVSVAVCTGGMGALFWMWVMTLLSMAIKYAEGLLAVKYRVTDSRGEMAGGPMYYIEKGLGWKWLAICFAICGAVAAIGTGNLVQVNSIAEALHGVCGIDVAVTGVVLAGVVTIVLWRGIKSIAYVSSVLVPLMAVFYIAAGLVVMVQFWEQLPAVFGLIVSSAWDGQAACGGFAGATVMTAIQMGVARSVFSSEAGLGISSIAAAAAKTPSSGRQALLSMAATLLSTAVICTITALVIGVTGVLGSVDGEGRLVSGASLAIAAFNEACPFGDVIVTTGLVLFAFTTVIAWAYYGEKCIEYLLGERWVVAYRILYAALVLPGALFALQTVWAFADITNALMVIPNMIALFGLAQVVRRETQQELFGRGECLTSATE